ncbi:MAG: hypothetical protein NTX51_01555, partial [Verrucomicrobia bacterium]|nr:hypothetical protein [Verrucomicrobiota bacterium]
MKTILILSLSLWVASVFAQSPPSTDRVRECERQAGFYQSRVTEYQLRLSQAKTAADRRTQESNIRSASQSLKTWQDSLVQAQREYDRRNEDYLKKQKSKLPPTAPSAQPQRNTARVRECERQVRFYQNKIAECQ